MLLIYIFSNKHINIYQSCNLAKMGSIIIKEQRYPILLLSHLKLDD